MNREKLEATTLIVLMVIVSGLLVYSGSEVMHGLPAFVISLGATL